jgi:hypothetical protein
MFKLTAIRACRSWDFAQFVVDLLALHRTVQGLRESGSSATLTRLFESKHVRDLKLIAGVAAWIILSGVVTIFAVFIYDLLGNHNLVVEAIGKFVATIGTVVGVGAVVVAWVYRTASVRLGVVDLFASEITTLCRVGTIVDIAQRSVAAFENVDRNAHSRTPAPPQDHGPYRFTSEENYFPVFTSNSRDLEVLEADVVVNVTAFYTYMKALRDYLRRVGVISASGAPETTVELRGTWRDIIYMLFLAYEAARNAINDLVEYEPHHMEYTITVLLTEVIAYRFLLDHFQNDFRYGRLMLRFDEYRTIAKNLEAKLHANMHDPRWSKPIELWDELSDRLRNLDIEVESLHGRSGTRDVVPSDPSCLSPSLAI